MKLKFLLLMCIIAICGIFPQAVYAAKEDENVFTSDSMESAGLNTQGIRQVVYFDETFYALMQDASVYAWHVNESKMELYSNLFTESANEIVHYIAAGDNALWGLNVVEGKIGIISATGISWLDTNFNVTSLFFDDDGSPRNVMQMFLSGKKLFAFVAFDYSWDSSNRRFELASIDMESGKYEIFDTQLTQGVCQYSEGYLLLLRATQKSQFVLSTLELNTGIITDLPYELPDLDDDTIGGLAFDLSTERILFLAQSQVWSSNQNRSFEVVAYVPSTLASARIPAWMLSDGRYAAFDGVLYLRAVEQNKKSNAALHIKAGYIVSGIYNNFVDENPHIPIVEINALSTADSVAQAVASGDTEIDIYQIELDYALKALILKGYAADMSASDTICRDVQNMHPTIQNVLTNQNGVPSAYPVNMFLYRFDVNKAFWELVFEEKPLPTTFSDFADAMIEWELEYADSFPEIEFVENFDHAYWVRQIVESFVQQYEKVGEPIDLLNPLLRDVLTKLETAATIREERGKSIHFQSMEEWGDTPTIFSISFPAAIENSELQIPIYRSQFVYDINPNDFSSCPLIFESGGTPSIRAGMLVWVINPNSEQYDLALRFVEYATRVRNNPSVYYAIHPEANEPLERIDFNDRVETMQNRREELEALIPNAREEELMDIEDALDYIERWFENQEIERWEIPATDIAEYRALSDSIRFYENSLYLGASGNAVQNTIDDLCNQYAWGTLDINSFLSELNKKVQMVYMENM